MQLSLLSRFTSGATLARSEPPSTVPGAWRDSAISQLDALAAANDSLAASARRRKIAWAVVLGGAALWLLSASLSTSVRNDAPRRPSVAPSALAPVSVPSATASVRQAPADPPAAQAEALPVAVAPIDDAARKPVVAVSADTRRKAAALAQERARLDEQALRRQREIEQAQAERASEQQQADAARERAAAVDQARRQSMMLAQNSQDTRRNVREVCASSGGFIAQQFCHSRECRKADFQDDAVCQRLREIEVARLLHGSDH
jgi:type IV secretory pathway VirB10-like protein